MPCAVIFHLMAHIDYFDVKIIYVIGIKNT